MHKVKRPPQPKPFRRALSPEEIEVLLGRVRQGKPVYVLTAHLALYLGLRRSEIVGLSWGDINFEAYTLTVNQVLADKDKEGLRVQDAKTELSRRTIHFTEEIWDLLRARLEFFEQMVLDGHLAEVPQQVCAQDDGRLLRPATLTKAHLRFVRRSGLGRFRLHDCRHTHSTVAVSNGAGIKDVSARLGHKEVAITLDVYTHVVPGDDEKTARLFADALKAC